MSKQILYAVLLGGKIRKNHLMEDHHLVFVVAENENEARKLAKKKWNTDEIHVDGTQKIIKVDGYKIILPIVFCKPDIHSSHKKFSYLSSGTI